MSKQHVRFTSIFQHISGLFLGISVYLGMPFCNPSQCEYSLY